MVAKQPTNTPVVEILEGRGLDIGTANLAVARYTPEGSQARLIESSIRDCFVAFPTEESGTLEVAGVDYQTSDKGDQLYVVGNDAVKLSVALGAELRRPLARGFVSEKEDLSKEVITLLLKSLLGEPQAKNELVVFSVPGLPIDGDTSRAQYHTRFFSDRLRELGYRPMPINEAMAVCFYELYRIAKSKETEAEGKPTTPPLTGLCFSFGAGMINVALVYQAMVSKSFSIPLGGDFIDETAAKITNSSPTQVCMLKEEGIDLIKGTALEARTYHDAVSTRQIEAICSTYRDLLGKLREALNTFFNNPANRVEIREVLPVIISGGTSQAEGFLQLFNEIVLGGLDVRLPLEKSAIQAQKPLGAVAEGALRLARLRVASASGK